MTTQNSWRGSPQKEMNSKRGKEKVWWNSPIHHSIQQGLFFHLLILALKVGAVEEVGNLKIKATETLQEHLEILTLLQL